MFGHLHHPNHHPNLNKISLKVNTKKTSGFTLVEMIIYVAIFSMIFTIILLLLGRVQVSGSRIQIASEIKENTAQVMQLMTKAAREADSIDFGNSVFGADSGRLVLNGDGVLTFDTHMKGITVGGMPVTIRKIKFIQGANQAVDITSDHVDVSLFRLTDLSRSGSPDSFQIELQLSSINPGGDADYEDSLTTRSSFTMREEL